MVESLICVVYGALSGLWRRGFGCDFWNIPVLKYRAVQHVLAFGALFPLFFWYKEMSFLWTVYIIAVIQGLFWAGGHGPAFDLSRGGQPDESMVKRYNDVWFAPIINFLVPQNMWYQFGYDYLWMAFRYTWPVILLVPVMGFSVLLLGPVVTLVYATCWSLSENHQLPFNLGPTQLAEIVAGTLAGMVWVVL